MHTDSPHRAADSKNPHPSLPSQSLLPGAVAHRQSGQLCKDLEKRNKRAKEKCLQLAVGSTKLAEVQESQQDSLSQRVSITEGTGTEVSPYPHFRPRLRPPCSSPGPRRCCQWSGLQPGPRFYPLSKLLSPLSTQASLLGPASQASMSTTPWIPACKASWVGQSPAPTCKPLQQLREKKTFTCRSLLTAGGSCLSMQCFHLLLTRPASLLASPGCRPYPGPDV